MLEKCIDYAMNYIYRFPKTEKELKAQLLKKGFLESEVNETMIFLKTKKYVDDENFAKLYIGSELIKKGKPAIVVKTKLMQKGIDKSLIQDIIRQVADEIDEGVQIRIKKEIEKYKKQGLDGFDIIRKLLGKGYNLSDIKKVL